MTKWILIPIEVKVREFPARLLVASLAAKAGYKVLFGQDRVIRRLIGHLPKGIVFDKSIGRKGDRKVAMFSSHGWVITALDEESTGYLDYPEVFSANRLAEETLDVTSRWFCLSDNVQKDISKRYPNHQNKFVTTGLIRMDLWRTQFQNLYEKDVEALRRKHGKFILFNSNFPTINHARGEEFKNRQIARSTKQVKNYNSTISRFKADMQANLDCYLETLPKFVEWFPDHKLLVRPHPSEDIKFWQKNLGILDNVEVVSGGLVTPWLLASDCMVHHGCTTGIEAELLGKPHVMYAPAPDKKHESDIMKSFATIVRTEKDLKEAISERLSNPDKAAKNRKTLEKHFASLEGKLASEKIVEEFDKIAIDGGDLPPYLSWLRFLPRQLVADYWPRSKSAKAYSQQKWDGSNESEVSEILKNISNSLRQETPPSVKQVYPDLFVIENLAQSH